MLRAQSDAKPVINPFYSPPISIPIPEPFAPGPTGISITEPFAPPAHLSLPSLRTNFLTSLNIYLLIVGFCLLSFTFYLALQEFYWTSVILVVASTFLILATVFYIFGANDESMVVFSAVLHFSSICFFLASIVIFLRNLAYHLDCNTWTGAFEIVYRVSRDPTVNDCENIKTYSIVGGSFIQLVMMLQVISIYGTYNLRQRYKWMKQVQESQIMLLDGGRNNQT